MKPLHILLFSICIVLSTSYSVFGQPTHFHFKANTGSKAIIGFPASINSTKGRSAIFPGDEIGVFTPGGLCVGSGVWTALGMSIVVWGDDPQTTAVDGIVAGEQMQFRIWRNLTNTEYPAQITYLFGMNTYAANGIYIVRSFITPSQLFVKVKVLLQGAYWHGDMTTTLNRLDCIPLNSNSAYNETTYGYSAKSVSFIPKPSVVDWILVELRTGTEASTTVETQVAFLLKNGSIVDIDGSSDVVFNVATPGDYYIVIRHRNHLAVMSESAVSLPNKSVYDFTTSQTQAFGPVPMKDLTGSHGPYAMWAGDINGNGIITYSGSGNDRVLILLRIGGVSTGSSSMGYYNEDINMNGVCTYIGSGNDRALLLSNLDGIVSGFRVTNVP